MHLRDRAVTQAFADSDLARWPFRERPCQRELLKRVGSVSDLDWMIALSPLRNVGLGREMILFRMMTTPVAGIECRRALGRSCRAGTAHSWPDPALRA